jgi:hypothetical protein
LFSIIAAIAISIIVDNGKSILKKIYGLKNADGGALTIKTSGMDRGG